MGYELRFATIAAEKLPKVPDDAADHIADGLRQLAKDPKKRRACQPFAPCGYQHDILVRDDKGRLIYNRVVFYVFSDCGKFIDIHRMIIQRIGVGPGVKLECDPMKVTGDITNIPQHAPQS
jgi:hypothetical protein